jgi:hypothetical protein
MLPSIMFRFLTDSLKHSLERCYYMHILVPVKNKNPANDTFTGFLYIMILLSAESGGFEPADPLTSQQFSRLPQSTTLPTLRDKSTNTCWFCK